MVNLGEIFPDFHVSTSEGEMDFHKFIDGSWAILFAHPADYTPVCTTELGCLVGLIDEFKKRGVKLVALSCDDVGTHKGWIEDIKAFIKTDILDFPYPIIADKGRELAVKLGMIDPEEKDSQGMPLTCRAVFIIGPDKKLKLSFLYPATCGRNLHELLRVIDSLQMTATKKVATPADWERGKPCMVLPTVKDEELKELFPKGVTVREMPSGKGYMRYTPDDPPESESECQAAKH